MLQWHNWTIVFNEIYSIDSWNGHVINSDKAPITMGHERLLEYSEVILMVSA